jgi:hypothetical protein
MDYRYVEIEPEDHGTIIPMACPRSLFAEHSKR